MRLVEGLPVAGVDAEPLATDDLIRSELPSGVRVADDLVELLPYELGGGVVGVLVEQQVVERAEEREAAARPPALVLCAPLLLGDLVRRPVSALEA